MPTRVNGAAFAHENLSRNLQYYTVYASSPSAYSDPDFAIGVHILVTGDWADDSQKSFEILMQSIGLRAMPVIMNNPVPVADLSVTTDVGARAPTLIGEGYIWKFAVELPEVFENFGPIGTIGPIGLLVDEMRGVILENDTVLETIGGTKNIEFTRQELL